MTTAEFTEFGAPSYTSSRFRGGCRPNPDCYLHNLNNWDFVIEALNGAVGVYPSDIDGCVEVSGTVLMLEDKRRGAPPTTAQLRMYQTLAGSHTPNGEPITVIMFRAGHPDISQLDWCRIEPSKDPEWQPISQAEFVDRLTRWAVRARGLKCNTA